MPGYHGNEREDDPTETEEVDASLDVKSDLGQEAQQGRLVT